MRSAQFLYHYVLDDHVYNHDETMFREMEKLGWVDNPGKAAPGKPMTKYQNAEVGGLGFLQSATDQCAIWNTVATDDDSGDLDGRIVNSLRTDGKYQIAGTAIQTIDHSDFRLKARLSSWIIEQRKTGIPIPEISTRTIKDLRNRQDLQVHERADRLLQFIESKTRAIGDKIQFSNQYVSAPAIAHSESTGIEEVTFLLDYLDSKGWIVRDDPLPFLCSLTVDGYSHIYELRSTNRDSSQAFVAMWFHDSASDAYENGIEPAIEQSGYKPVRVDKEEHNNKIDDQIIAEIRRSRFIVADFTQGESGARGGVYYEAGFAHGLGIEVIFTCRESSFQEHEKHLDTRQYNHIVWSDVEELRTKLSDRISAILGDGPLKRDES